MENGNYRKLLSILFCGVKGPQRRENVNFTGKVHIKYLAGPFCFSALLHLAVHADILHSFE